MTFTLLKANEEVSFVSILPFALFSFVFIVLNIIGERYATKAIQVLFLFLIAYFIIMTNEIGYQVGYILFIFIYFLSRKYLLFNKNIYVFNTLIISFLVFSIFVSAKNFTIEELTNSGIVSIWHVANQLLFICATIILIYIVFEDDIIKLTLENQSLNKQIEKSSVFVNLGENISGLVHNMNGDLGLMSLSVSMMEEEVDHKAVDFVRTGNRNLQAKIRNILTLAKYSQAEEDMEFSINALLYSLLEVFGINKDYKIISTETDFHDEVFFYGNPSEISQVFENLIKNAYEALLEKRENQVNQNEIYLPQLKVEIEGSKDKSQIRFIDNGPGIKACLEKDCKKNCVDCGIFKVGKTTKSTGTGLGMISVIRTLKKYEGILDIKTSAEEGTAITVALSRG